ncbi:hypothetical protein JXA32_17740 [Candidatus Sumerlaeota bacterium]|nr:hypothetical protein [Candidatus Sumerlaeota bacterium]
MTAREIVRLTLDFEGPERVARSFKNSDIVSGGCSAQTHSTDWREIGGGRWERTDEWGNLWARIDKTSKGEVVKGVLQNISDLDSYEFPDYSKPEDYACVAKRRADHPDKWLIGDLPGFAFNIARKMRKLDQYLMDLFLEPDRMHELHDRIDVMLEHMIRNYAAQGCDCVMLLEDWGTQTQLLISPDMWRQEFFPRFVKLCGIAHELNLKVFMHSCGMIAAIIPGLMEAGVDLLQFDQPDLHGIDTLASYQENGKITFWCPVDIQKTLQKRDEEIIRAKAREMLDKLWKGRGGFLAGYYWDNTSIGLDPMWQEYACEEFIKHGTAGRYA